MGKKYKIFAYIILVLTAISMLIPLLWTVSASFQNESQIFSSGINLLPKTFTTQNYSEITNKLPISRYFFNSLFVAVTTTFFQVIVATMAGYAFA